MSTAKLNHTMKAANPAEYTPCEMVLKMLISASTAKKTRVTIKQVFAVFFRSSSSLLTMA